MFRINIPFLDSLKTQNEAITIQEYHIFSSIFEMAPRMSVTLTTTYETPEVLGCYLGTSFPIKYVIEELEPEEDEETALGNTAIEAVKKLSGKTGDDVDSVVEDGVRKYDPVDLIGMFVSQVSTQSTDAGINTTITCDSDFLAFQRSDIRKAYVDAYGNTIVEDIIQDNQVLQKYDTDISNTDNVSTVYRSLGESDIDLLKNNIGKQYLIAGGQPLFYVGLDKKVNFTSAAKLLTASQKTNLLIQASGGTNDDLSGTIVNELIENYVDTENYIKLPAINWELTVGKDNSVFNLKSAAYYSDTYTGFCNSTGYVFKPASEKKLYYPVDNIFINMIDAKQSVQTFNRASSTICYEAKNYFASFENLCTVKVTLADANSLNRLYTAGETVTFMTPYPYSIYNGNYVIAEIEYGQSSSIAFVEMILIRPQIDPFWAEKISKGKDSGDFKFPLAPELDKSSIYSI